MVAPGQTFLIQRMGGEEGPFTLADLQAQVKAKYIRATTMVRKADATGAWFPASEIPGLYSDKEFLTTPVKLDTVLMSDWKRSDFYDASGLPWVPPSPNDGRNPCM